MEPQIVITKPNARYQALRSRFKQEGFLKQVIEKVEEGRQGSQQELNESAIPDFKKQSSTITQFEDEYDTGEAVGQGANAVVRKCYRRRDGQLLAVKVSQVEEEQLLYLKKLFARLSVLSHENMVSYKATYINMRKRTCHLVMDYVSHPSLREFIYSRTRKPLAEAEIREIMRQLFDVLRFLHANRICHRDVKPDNILYDRQSNKIWLIDFGVSKLMLERNVAKTMMTNTGTCEYKAPEIYDGGRYTENIDLWAAGVVLYEMVERRSPFSKEYISDTIQSICEIDYEEGEVWHQVNRYARDLLHRLLKPASKRLSAEEAVNAFWFKQHNSYRPPLILSSLTSPSISVECWKQEMQEVCNTPLTPLLVLQKSPRSSKEPLTPDSPTVRSYQPSTPLTPGSQAWAVGDFQKANVDNGFYIS